jgi:hypothetical protein
MIATAERTKINFDKVLLSWSLPVQSVGNQKKTVTTTDSRYSILLRKKETNSAIFYYDFTIPKMSHLNY